MQKIRMLVIALLLVAFSVAAACSTHYTHPTGNRTSNLLGIWNGYFDINGQPITIAFDSL